jgi:NAD+ kinase
MYDSNKRVAILSKPQKPELAQIVPALVAWLRIRGFETIADGTTAQYLTHSADAGVKVFPREEVAHAGLAFAIVLGGDGTLLSAARAVSRANVPILAVNLGSLGFLTEVRLEDLYPTLEAWCDGRVQCDRRAMLQCDIYRDGRCIAEYEALNDVVVAKANIARIADLSVFVGGNFVANYMADGVIIATPTGSTAYSLAAGGPVVAPNLRVMLVTPVSPHALTNRPLVVSGDDEITIRMNRADQLFVTSDGQEAQEITVHDEIRCRLSKNSVRLIRPKTTNFFDVLRTKLKWGER